VTTPSNVRRTVQLVLARLRIDLEPHPGPTPARLVLASLVALVGSLIADALLVAAGKAVFPSTKHYVHFQPADYGKLTIIGVVIACAAWPIVTRISPSPRWLFLRMAIAVTVVLYVPDAYLLSIHQPAKGVAVLMCMHLAIAIVTYNALVRIAPVRTTAHARA
jgi:uncharacterized membrane protein YraQ (UPF0718 family)